MSDEQEVRTSYHKGYNMITEHGEWVAYKSGRFTKIGIKDDGETPILKPTAIDRVVLGTSDLMEACDRLDNKLKKEKAVKEDNSGNYKLKLEP